MEICAFIIAIIALVIFIISFKHPDIIADKKLLSTFEKTTRKEGIYFIKE